MDATPSESATDVAVILGGDSDRNELHVLRQRADTVEAGVVRPVVTGQPILGDIVKLKPRKDSPLVCDVEVVLEHPEPETRTAKHRSGPTRVSTDAYRQGWDAIFGNSAADTVN